MEVVKERRKEESYFGHLTPRMKQYREAVLNKKPYIDAERAVLSTEAYKENQGKHIYMQRSLMLKNILEKMTIYLEDETFIAGNQASSNNDAPVFPEYTMEFVIDELDKFEKRDGDVFYITEETKENLRSIAPYWEGKSLRDYSKSLLPDEIAPFLGFFGMEGKMNSGDAHLAADYPELLKEGLRGYEERTRQHLSELDFTVPENIDKYHFYHSVLIVIEAVDTYAKRYSKLALEMAATATPERAEELREISRITGKIPYEPAETFREALQAVWFIQVILQIESNGHSLSYGRFDQYMQPYYEADIAAGRITDDEVVELLGNLWIKTETVNKVRSQSHTYGSAGSPLYQNVTIGGQTRDKKDAVNKMSYLVLKSVAQTRLPQPNLTVRYHAGLDDEFMKECIEVVKLGFGMPAFNNDETIIQSFIDYGVDEADAFDYSAIGCVETAVPGKWGYRCTGMSYVNFPKVLLITMNNGIDPDTGLQFAKGLGHFTEMDSYEDLMVAWDSVLREITRMSVAVENICDIGLERKVPDILCSTLTQDCIGRGKPIKEGGALYDYISGLQVGIANTADSLAAIKKLVFEDERISQQELWDALMGNFQGERGLEIQDILIHEAPKYGNDIDYVDQLVVDAYESYIDEVEKYPNTRHGRGPIGGGRYAGTSSISANVSQGMGTLATPDGRNAHEPLAEGCSPSHNMDQNGPTGVFNSIAKLPTEKIVGGVLLNQKVNPSVLAKETDTMKLIMLIRAFFNRLKGYHVQYNVVSRETLIDAQENPDDHRDLIVRVAGYSAFFNVLSKATQDDIIARTEHSL